MAEPKRYDGPLGRLRAWEQWDVINGILTEGYAFRTLATKEHGFIEKTSFDQHHTEVGT